MPQEHILGKTSLEGMIFDIQRYSIHDGPGIRTTVFLKDCPLRCRWCSNPESWGSRPELFYMKSRCIGCGTCKTAPEAPETVCPTGALCLKGEQTSAEKVFAAVLRDLPYYQRSGGGVTLSGGEPLLQKDFAAEILRLCREAGIHTAVETTGLVPWETFEALEGLVDLYLYDFKHPDPELHRKWTGRSNEQILENLDRLSRTSACIHVRVPVIPGVNDQPETLREIASFLNAHGIRERTLLPFHQYGSSKYQSLGLTYEMEGVPQLTEERLKELAEASHFYETEKSYL